MTEDEIQIAVFEHLRTRPADGVFAFHPKNGGAHQRTRGQRIFNAKKGVVSGVPDVCAVKDGWFFALELKTEDGAASDDQIETMQALQRAGTTVACVYGLNAALRKLEQWGLLKGTTA